MSIGARTADGREMTLTKEKLDALRTALRGPVHLPGEPAYDESRSLWNAMLDRRPALVARCLGTADIVACVRFAREHDVALSIKGGGHNIAGLAVCDGALMIDTSAMRGVVADPRAKVAYAQPGCLLGDVDRETQLHGLAAVLGFVSATGAAGLTLGGGFGYLTRRFGWTCDNVRAISMVTAEGELVRASEDEHADLFWGLRGGGGNFGVATGFEHELHAVGPEILGGVMAWPGERAREVLGVVRDISARAPRELTFATMLRLAPPAPWIAKDAHGKPIVGVLACWTGNLDEGERVLAPLRALGGSVGDVLARRPYAMLQSMLDATQPKGRRYYWKAEYLPAYSDALVDKAIANAARIPSPHSALVTFQLGGALADRPSDFSAAGNRDAAWVLNITSQWEHAKDDEANVEWARSAWRDMRELSTGGTYVNFLTEDEGGDRIRSAYGENYARLAELKRKWDPTNVFRANKNIAV
ncbi:MAG: FAD-binding oxidoreductase [Deltaproteobacteria bacterium]|nr:FAD-binding oxidoreductase [Deltaproteobacteria bacterium]